MSNVIADLGNSIKRDDVPAFRAGDTIKVHVKVVEGHRSRVKIFPGVDIRIHGSERHRQCQINHRRKCNGCYLA